MKKIIAVFGAILFASFIMTSCGSSTKEKSNDEKSSVSTSEKSGDNSASDQKESSTTSEKTSSPNATGDCDQFLKDYENFMTKYIAAIKKYQANPTDPTGLADYTSVSKELQSWSAKTANCAADPAYAAKFAAVAMKIANAASGL